MFSHLWSLGREADFYLLWHINSGWTSPFLDRLMYIISAPRYFVWPAVAAILALLLFGGRRGRVFLLLLALAVGLGDGVIDNFGKKIVHRARPNESMVGLRVVEASGVHESWPVLHPGGRSFPSGHVFNNVALAMLACAVYGTRRFWWVWAWAALVGYSRIYLGAHYPSDVLGSALLAILYTWAILAAARWAWRRWRSPWSAPTLF
jgi:undecaprenyl-diphosphatase